MQVRLITHRPALTQAGFSADDIVKIAAHGGGAQALQAVITHHPALADAGFSADDIVKIAGNPAGAQALQAVITHHPALTEAGYTKDQIMALAGLRRGAAGARRAAAGACVDESRLVSYGRKKTVKPWRIYPSSQPAILRSKAKLRTARHSSSRKVTSA